MANNREYKMKLEKLRDILVDTLARENLPSNSCVKNDVMSDHQENPGHLLRPGSGGGRPSSAKLNRERQERIVLLKEKQDHDRIKKLEELKEQALAASKLREEQDSRRKKHFEELVRKEDDRRKQAEERRRMLDEERKLALQAKWESRKSSNAPTPTPGQRPSSARPTFAFGSCTPRLVDNHVDGFLWKSQYNLNVTREPGMRASSAQDLHIQQNEVRLSASMYDWNQQRTTIDNPLVHRSGANGGGGRHTKSRNYDGAEAMRMFCGRRKTDLTPTVPIKRDTFDMSGSMSASMMSRSTSRGSGRVYSSMTRLDRSRSPGGNLSTSSSMMSQHQHQPARPSRSKSTTHLQSTGLKLTRTEILRQALAAKKDKDGFRSVDQSRPPSSMSSSVMTSSVHSQVQMRPRNLVRKSRPASVHVTGISQGVNNDSEPPKPARLRRSDTSQERKQPQRKLPSTTTTNTTTDKSEVKTRVSGKTSPSPHETSTMKRPQKKQAVAVATVKNNVNNTNEASSKVLESDSSVPVVVDGALDNNNPFSNDLVNINSTQQMQQEQVISNNKNNVISENSKIIENFESIESAFASGSDNDFKSATPEPSHLPFSPEPTNPILFPTLVTPPPSVNLPPVVVAQPEVKVEEAANNAESDKDLNLLGVGGENNLVEVLNQPKSVSPVPEAESNKPNNKIMTEAEAKAAIAEKRRLAREAAEREQQRLEEEERLEEERQRLEAEEAERVVREARAAEEERLRIAIEEQQKREFEEKLRREEEEKARIEKEKQDREAAREAERIRLEMEERLKREEEERLERRKRVEAIMARTRKKEAEQQAKTQGESIDEGLNGHKENNGLGEVENNVQLSSNNAMNNNYNNNNDFVGGNNSTLIEFDGMMGVQETNNTPENHLNNTSNNPLINNTLQDLLS